MIAALHGERQFAGFGAAPHPDLSVCHAKKPVPHPTVRRLQVALRDLARRVSDAKIDPRGTDGLVGPHTVKAVNYAVPKYTDAPDVLSTGKLTHAQVVSFSPQIAAFVEKAPHVPVSMPAPQSMPAAAPAVLPSAPSPMYTRPPGGTPMPYPPVQYYPPGYAPAPSYPGYAPRREASVDIKTFIPAQYEHVHFNPVTVAVVIGVGVAAVMITQKRERGK